MTWMSSSEDEESVDWRLSTERAGKNLASAGKSSSVVSPSSAAADHVSITTVSVFQRNHLLSYPLEPKELSL